ncbi:MAG: hypothetical protein S4CHLAM6_01260 [Chlamydiae bacterium]|nr:hypothetical protein [Chlamydiota bacterium]
MEINKGVRRVLTFSFVYNLFCKLFAKPGAWKSFINEYILNKPCFRVLDCGCGTASILKLLPKSIDYTGVDLSEDYIQSAKKELGDRGKFYCLDINSLQDLNLEKFDTILLLGLLHHLSDSEASNLLGELKKMLSINGRIITYDGCFLEKQNPISRFLLKKDRGQNIRFPHEYRALAEQAFDNVKIDVRNDYLRVPFDQIAMELS